MKCAFVFPGQGSQSVGMLSGFQGNAAVEEAIAVASAALGEDLGSLIAQGPAEDLNLTVNTQPVMVASAVAFYQAFRAAGGAAPSLMAGHSLGEYAALCAAQAISLSDAVRAVRFRAQQMQSAVPVGVGGMAAILGLAAHVIEAHCQAHTRSDAIVEAVNLNAPDQTVIAGHLGAVQSACEALKALGAKRALMLPVSAPFHSSLLEPAARALADYLPSVSWAPPSVPVLHNVDVEVHATPDAIVGALSAQAMRPVQWVKTIQAMADHGITHVVECGPGKVLSGLVKRIDPAMTTLNIFDQASLEACLEVLG
ncbi:MAG: hypothetical protein RL133_734 [Pseudomonadota bacterium]